MKTNMASEGDVLPTDVRLEGKYLAFNQNPSEVDLAFLRLDDSIAELYGLAESVHRENGNLDETAERYASFYETSERIIVRLLKLRGIEVNPRRTGPYQHSYHEAVLQILADKANVFHHILGGGVIQEALHHAKTFRNKHRACALSAEKLPSQDGPRVASRARLIAQAIHETSQFARFAVTDGYLNSILGQLLETHAVEKATTEIERIHRNWLALQGSGHTRTLSTVTEFRFHLELGSNGCNLLERGRSAFSEALGSNLSILQETLNDVSSMFERVPDNGKAQRQLLNRFVSSRLDERRQKATGYLDIRMCELSARTVGLILARVNKVVDLETLNEKSRFQVGASKMRLRLETVEAKKRTGQVESLQKENKELKIKLPNMTSNHINTLDCSKAVSLKSAALQSQLEAERKSHEACRIRTAAVEEREKSHNESCSYDAYQELKTEHEATKKYAACAVDGHALLSTRMSTMQEEMGNLRAELAAERSLHETTEGKARRLEDEVNSIRAGMESMLISLRELTDVASNKLFSKR